MKQRRNSTFHYLFTASSVVLETCLSSDAAACAHISVQCIKNEKAKPNLIGCVGGILVLASAALVAIFKRKNSNSKATKTMMSSDQ